MKSSFNLPEWLYDQVQRTCPGQPFGTLVRDALIIALPVWSELGPERALEQALQSELRILAATAAAQGVELPPEARPSKPGRRRAAAQAPAPEAPPAGRPAGGRKSQTKPRSPSPLTPAQRIEQARSHRQAKPTAGSSETAKSSTAAGARTPPASKTPAATAD